MQECFLSSTTRDVVPVAAVDGLSFDVRRIGRDEVEGRVRRICSRLCALHPELSCYG